VVALAGCASGQSSQPDGPQQDHGTPAFPDGGPRWERSDATAQDTGPASSITVTFPTGGESWPAGSSQSITWSSTGAVGAVDIELWRAGSLHTSIAAGQTNSGSHSWSIPADTPHGEDYTVRIVDPAAGVEHSSPAPFTITNWRYRIKITITSSQALTDHQVRVPLGPAVFDYSHACSNGADLRLAQGSTFTGTFNLPHWIESWSAGSNSTVWVKIPSIPASGPTEVYLYYGQPTATDESSLDQTFPNRFVSSGNLTLGGLQSHDWFELKNGHSLTVKAGQALTITAPRLLLEGIVEGTGSGQVGGTSGAAGQGQGGGGGSTNSGGGGGGHGGKGGKGGHDSNDTPGNGGLTYGSTTNNAIEMGSGGGAGNNSAGGAGGGAVTLSGTQVVVKGTVRMDGAAGIGAGQSSGGGSGGGILITADDLVLTGTCSVRGGAGGSGSITANDGGGGGGGGRIKIRYGQSLVNTVTLVTTGGAGGKYGDTAYGEAGLAGTLHSVKQATSPLTITLGPEEQVQ